MFQLTGFTPLGSRTIFPEICDESKSGLLPASVSGPIPYQTLLMQSAKYVPAPTIEASG
jgi:hypothetical protein